MLAPLGVVLALGDTVAGAIGASLSDVVSNRLKDDIPFAEAIRGVADEAAIRNSILIVYLAWGAVVAAIGNGLRAFAHNDKPRGAADFAGKFLAVAAGFIAATAAVIRFYPTYGTYMPKWVYWALISAVVLVILVGWIGGLFIKSADERADEAKAKASAEAAVEAEEASRSADDGGAEGGAGSNAMAKPKSAD